MSLEPARPPTEKGEMALPATLGGAGGAPVLLEDTNDVIHRGHNLLDLPFGK